MVRLFHSSVVKFLLFLLGLIRAGSRLVPLAAGSRLVKPLVVASWLVRGGSPATFLLPVPGVAFLAEGALTTLSIISGVWEVAPVLVSPAGEARRGNVEVLHLNGQGL